MRVCKINGRYVAVGGVGQIFYQDGLPMSIAIDELAIKGIEVSLYHAAEECMNNGWSAATDIRKFRGETDLDINKSMSTIDWNTFVEFCNCLEQPLRGIGGYERSREIIFEYLFGCSYADVSIGKNTYPLDWGINFTSHEES